MDTVVDRSVGGEVRIDFQVEEGEPIRVDSVSLPGLEELTDSSVVRGIPLRVGDPLSLIALESSRDRLPILFRKKSLRKRQNLPGRRIASTAAMKKR